MSAWLTTFDAAAEPFRWGNAGEGLAALALIALGISISSALRRRGSSAANGVLALACGVAVFFAVRTIDHLQGHQACVDAARAGEGTWIEGVVERVEPAGSGWPWSAAEQAFVDGQVVRYPVFASGCGYYRRAPDGGVRQGARVRLRLWHEEILKVEVADAGLPRPARPSP